MNLIDTTTVRPLTRDRITFSDFALSTLDYANDMTVHTVTVADVAALHLPTRTRRPRTSHALCDHENTKAARAKCRRDRLPVDASDMD